MDSLPKENIISQNPPQNVPLIDNSLPNTQKPNNNGPLLIIIIVGIIFITAVGVLSFFVLNLNSTNHPKESQTQIVSSPTPSPQSQETAVKPNAQYQNPFDKSTQYVNPFSGNKNPFDNLK